MMNTRSAFSENKPHVSWALSVTTQAEAIKRNKYFKEHGINARHEEFRDGMPSPLKSFSRKGLKQANEALGVVNREGGYSDYTGK